jgi:hypothetical protein
MRKLIRISTDAAGACAAQFLVLTDGVYFRKVFAGNVFSDDVAQRIEKLNMGLNTRRPDIVF